MSSNLSMLDVCVDNVEIEPGGLAHLTIGFLTSMGDLSSIFF